MRKHMCFLVLTSSVLVFTFFISLTLDAQIKPTPRARVIFLDGFVQNLEQVSFVYHWIYQRDQKYFNPPYHRKESSEFHYAEVVRNVQIDRVLSGHMIAKIELSWPKPEKKGEGYFSPNRITITLNEGKVVILKDIDVTPVFLLGQPIKEIGDSVVLRQLDIEGIAIVEGQRGKFTGRLFSRAGVHLQPKEAIKEIIFIGPKD
jgi:hypothetical protein